MIVNPLSTGWEIFYHRGHALLAAEIGSHLTERWRVGDRPARLIETIAAIFHHDDAAREWESNQLSEVGTPLDFTMPTPAKSDGVQPMRELVEGALYRGRYVALLVSMHCSFLNEPKRGQSPELDAFLNEQSAVQADLRKQLKLSQRTAGQAYAFMQWCDRLSLILVQRELPQRERALEVSKGPDGKRYDVAQRADGTVRVTPWPFDEERFCVNAEACYLDQAVYKNNQALIDAMKHTRVETVEWEFVSDSAQKGVGRRKRKPTKEQRRAKAEAAE